MSLEEPRAREVGVTEEGTVDYDTLADLLGDHVLGRETHLNAEAFVVRPDAVQDVLLALRDEAGFDHLSCLTAQEYEDRYESIYHLTKYDARTQEVSIVVPLRKDDPRNESAEPVYRTAEWHEREAYDLVGIRYDGLPDHRRILLPETWQGHPLSLDYHQDKPQVVTLREHKNPLEGDYRHPDDADTMVLNIGPHHPATHGVLHLKTTLDGEQVVDVDPDVGYLHRCEEQMAQQGTYRYQIIPYSNRWDYTANLPNEWAVTSILEDLTGQRMMFYYFRIGGVCWDIPDPREEWFAKVRDFLDHLPGSIEEYHDLFTANEVFQLRTVDTGVLEPDVAKQYGVTGPVARASGIDYDLRRDDPYGYYPNLDWEVVTEDGCDNFSRLLVRLGEIEQSARIVEQCIDLLEDWPEDDRQVQANVPRTIKPPDDAEIYRAVESAKGELGVYIRSDNTQKPARFKIRSPCYHNLSALPEMAEGDLIPDLIASLGSLDIVLGSVDR